ncbi:MAG: hypothetical protein JWN75_1080 [Candidatus Saccharibacteria bacterium]|nr:hypothetical protein [Candidatus Saccharibacteria bacterium]
MAQLQPGSYCANVTIEFEEGSDGKSHKVYVDFVFELKWQSSLQHLKMIVLEDAVIYAKQKRPLDVPGFSFGERYVPLMLDVEPNYLPD